MSTSVDTASGATLSGMTVGTPTLASVGAITFGLGRVLFVADNQSASIVAIDVGAGAPSAPPASFDVTDLDARLAAFLGCTREQVFIRDLAVHPTTGQVYLSVMRGSGAEALPALLTVGADGVVAEVNLTGVPFARMELADAPVAGDERVEGRVVQGSREGSPYVVKADFSLQVAREPLRTVTITDLAFVDGILLVAGASNQEFSSTLRRIPFPFTGRAEAHALEIFHVSHAKWETASPIRTFVPYDGNASILASYTCTPVVHFSVEDVAAGDKITGRTVAELGGGNTPLDMVAFTRGVDEYLLVSNVRHPLMKLKKSDIRQQSPLTEPHEPTGVPRENLPQEGVSKMANLGPERVLMLQMDAHEHYHLHAYTTDTL